MPTTRLSTVVERGERVLVEAWLSLKFDQWADVRPQLVAAYQVAVVEPEIQAGLDAWFEDVAGLIQEGLDRAGRFDTGTRRIRAVLAFGQLEYLANRWLRVGWAVEREICLQTLTDSWCPLGARGLIGCARVPFTGWREQRRAVRARPAAPKRSSQPMKASAQAVSDAVRSSSTSGGALRDRVSGRGSGGSVTRWSHRQWSPGC